MNQNTFYKNSHYLINEDRWMIEEIGLILGATRERARQLESTTIKKLKQPSIAR